MELSPRLYRLFVRPPLLTNIYFNKKLNHLLSSFSFDDKYVLDFGCGIGSSSFKFHPDFYTGIDCDKKRISYAKYLYPKYRFISSQKDKISLDDNSTDYIYISAVLHHIPHNSLRKYMEEFHRILKSSGQIIVVEPCFYHGAYLPNWFMSTFDKGKYIKSRENYLNLFHKHKFTTQNIHHFSKNFVYNEIFFTAKPLK